MCQLTDMQRLLIIEDNLRRIELFKQWLPKEIIPIFAMSAGRALGVLQRDVGRVYMGVLLDHDLDEQPAGDSDFYYSGTDVVNAIVQQVSIDTPILVHSMNYIRAQLMVRQLELAGFYVTRIPMSQLERENLLEWVDEARDIWLSFDR